MSRIPPLCCTAISICRRRVQVPTVGTCGPKPAESLSPQEAGKLGGRPSQFDQKEGLETKGHDVPRLTCRTGVTAPPDYCRWPLRECYPVSWRRIQYCGCPLGLGGGQEDERRNSGWASVTLGPPAPELSAGLSALATCLSARLPFVSFGSALP